MSDSTPWVINASPLILLAKLARTELLDGLTNRVLVPEAVVREVAAGGNTGVGLATALDFAKSRTVTDIPVPGSILGWDLGAGESQVLAHCLAGGYLAVLDDGEARAAAKVHAVPHVGTLGVILGCLNLAISFAHFWTFTVYSLRLPGNCTRNSQGMPGNR